MMRAGQGERHARGVDDDASSAWSIRGAATTHSSAACATGVMLGSTERGAMRAYLDRVEVPLGQEGATPRYHLSDNMLFH